MSNSYETFLFNVKKIPKEVYYPQESKLLAILAWLCKEVARHGGTPYHLQPGTHHRKAAGSLRIPTEKREKGLQEILQYALHELPVLNEPSLAKDTQEAMRKILAKWGTAKKGWKIVETVSGENRLPSLHWFEDLRYKTLALRLNPCHDPATWINYVNVFLNDKGAAQIVITYGYKRDGSSWSISGGDPEYYAEKARPAEAKFVEELSAKPGEIAEETISRVFWLIQENTIEGLPAKRYGDAYNAWIAPHRRKIQEEIYFNKLKPILRGGMGFNCGNLRANQETKDRFGNEGDPYFIEDEAASLLAQFMAKAHHSEGELTCLAKGLRRLSKISKVSDALEDYQKSIKEIRHPYFKTTVTSDFGLLKAAKKVAKEMNAQIFVWVPNSLREMKGLKRVPLDSLKITKGNTMLLNGKRVSITEIRQFDAC